MEKKIALYFSLSDIAKGKKAQMEIVDLFAKNAVIVPNRAARITGQAAIQDFFAAFFSRNKQLKHL